MKLLFSETGLTTIDGVKANDLQMRRLIEDALHYTPINTAIRKRLNREGHLLFHCQAPSLLSFSIGVGILRFSEVAGILNQPKINQFIRDRLLW